MSSAVHQENPLGPQELAKNVGNPDGNEIGAFETEQQAIEYRNL
jgi:hypothetical protein